AGAARPRREEWLEQARSALGGYAGTVVVQLADHRVAHVAGAGGDNDARRLFLAVLPRVAHQIPDDLAQVPTIEDHQHVIGNPNHDVLFADMLGLRNLVAHRRHELAERDDFRLLAVAAI